ncbi:hypothetical protein NLX86_30080 [Streptomyces sp. A3M-1-3]|uniref:hypothetical protein n=1 Tax=Streptomyces sp. A3M-1-3 TaxID=2962044 RepID=UPI0020B89F75|nr:hypothetical protein [Streptomyces sp. A3M-1-3]MCP3822186.1 hypothetical protein [Streptomyces sp. A3M-1-3]
MVLLAACTSEGGQAAPAKGQALAGGQQSNGVVGSEHAKVGQTWWFALPVPYNTSSSPIEITNVELVDVPKGITVLDYGAYSSEDTEGVALLVVEGDKYTPRFHKLKNHAADGVVVPAGKESDIYYLAKMKIIDPPKGAARYCRFDYRQAGKEYTQTLDCEVELTTE